jgi:DNA-binding MarR family transcriptional regulator
MSKKLSSPNHSSALVGPAGEAPALDRYGMREADALHRELSFAVIAFHEALSAQAGMSAAERKVFGLLAVLGAATPSQLAKESGLTTGAITGIVDRLERAGYARREPNPADRRSLIVRPLQAQKVHELHMPAFQSLTEAMTALRARYSPAQLEAIYAYLAETTAVLKQETAKLGKPNSGKR